MRITCVHQGYELYGSDRSFIESVKVMRDAYPEAEIDVVLPRHGPIVEPLRAVATRILIEPVWVLRRHGLARLLAFAAATLPVAVGRAMFRLRRSDLVYVNTSVVADYLIASGFVRGKTIAHVHEIPEGATRWVLNALLFWSGARILFNSQATRQAFALPRRRRQHVIYNGIADPGSPKPMRYDGGTPLRLLMLGRLSRIKGQDVLLDAIARMPPALRERLELRIVGNAFENPERERRLDLAIKASGLGSGVTLLPFTADPSEHFRWADVVLVPSRLPESLGRVAIEAMAHGVPALVSDIGGLPEVVEDGRSGWLVPPGDTAALADKLAHVMLAPEAWATHPACARRRYETTFSQDASARAFAHLLNAALSEEAPDALPVMQSVAS